MAIEDWIDDVVQVAGSVKSHEKGIVRAYQVVSKAEFPESITVRPCVLVYPTSVVFQLSAGMSKEIWRGVCEFYLFPNKNKSNIPTIVKYYRRIRDAFAGAVTLGGKVDHFCFAPGENSLEFSVLQYGDEAEGHGITVRWEVKADVSSEVTVGG